MNHAWWPYLTAELRSGLMDRVLALEVTDRKEHVLLRCADDGLHPVSAGHTCSLHLAARSRVWRRLAYGLDSITSLAATHQLRIIGDSALALLLMRAPVAIAPPVSLTRAD